MATLYSSDATKVEVTPFGLFEISLTAIPFLIIGWFLKILSLTVVIFSVTILVVKILQYFSILKFYRLRQDMVYLGFSDAKRLNLSKKTYHNLKSGNFAKPIVLRKFTHTSPIYLKEIKPTAFPEVIIRFWYFDGKVYMTNEDTNPDEVYSAIKKSNVKRFTTVNNEVNWDFVKYLVKKPLFLFLLLLTIVAFLFGNTLSSETAYVSRIIDGDTIELSNGERVRLIGIDTPERGEPYYNEATNHLAGLILNKNIEMKKDTSDRDRYDRLLRYIYLDDSFINMVMVQEGFAESYCYSPDTKYCSEFNEAEEKAREQKKGRWATDSDGSTSEESNWISIPLALACIALAASRRRKVS